MGIKQSFSWSFQIDHWWDYNDNIPTLEIRGSEYILVFDGYNGYKTVK